MPLTKIHLWDDEVTRLRGILQRERDEKVSWCKSAIKAGAGDSAADCAIAAVQAHDLLRLVDPGQPRDCPGLPKSPAVREEA